MQIPDSNLLESESLELKLENEFESQVIDSDKKIELIVKALSSKTRRQILAQIQHQPLDVSNIAANLDMTEANISAQIKMLQKAGLITCDYRSGQHGVRKLSSLKYNQLTITF